VSSDEPLGRLPTPGLLEELEHPGGVAGGEVHAHAAQLFAPPELFDEDVQMGFVWRDGGEDLPPNPKRRQVKVRLLGGFGQRKGQAASLLECHDRPPSLAWPARCPTTKTIEMKRWWLDELAHAGQEHLDPRYVTNHERKAGFDPTEDIDALRLRGLGPDSIVVDLGAGVGSFIVAAARVCRRVIAVDVSPAMTAALRKRIDTFEIANVAVVDAGFLSYEHCGQAADVMFTRNALHQLPDFWKAIALERMASYLRPGGVLRRRDLVYDFAPADAESRIETWMSGAVTDPSIGWTADELADHVRGEFSTFSWLLDVMLERTGFNIVDRSFCRSAYGAYTCERRAA
jgi:SAM-dependent methyltransferase